jgi:hypothetical protein
MRTKEKHYLIPDVPDNEKKLGMVIGIGVRDRNWAGFLMKSFLLHSNTNRRIF